MTTVPLLIIEDNYERREIYLTEEVYYLGRSSNCCNICLFSRYVGRRQATLVRKQHDDGSLYYQIIDSDLQGKPTVRGLLINGEKLQSHDLENEDEIVFGPEVRAIYYIPSHPQIDPQCQPVNPNSR